MNKDCHSELKQVKITRLFTKNVSDRVAQWNRRRGVGFCASGRFLEYEAGKDGGLRLTEELIQRCQTRAHALRWSSANLRLVVAVKLMKDQTNVTHSAPLYRQTYTSRRTSTVCIILSVRNRPRTFLTWIQVIDLHHTLHRDTLPYL